MLEDIERKVLRVIANFSVGRRRMPTLDELCIKTGRTRAGMYRVLHALAKDEYIEWTPVAPEQMTLLEAWERKGPYSYGR